MCYTLCWQLVSAQQTARVQHHIITGSIWKERSPVCYFPRDAQSDKEDADLLSAMSYLKDINWTFSGWTRNPANVKGVRQPNSLFSFALQMDSFPYVKDGMSMWDGCYAWIMHVSPSVSCYCSLVFHSCRECAWHLQPDHSSSPHSLQLGLWVHQATLWPWKKQEPQLHRVHPVSAGTCVNDYITHFIWEPMSCIIT